MAKILIIEDEAGIRMTLEDRLHSEGYETELRGDGISGEKEAETGAYDLILLDVMLPGRDGFTLCHNLRRKNIHTPILMLTARDTSLDNIMGLRQGADDYMAKPFDMALLVARIEALIRRAAIHSGQADKKAEIFCFGDFVLDLKKGMLYRGNEPVTLHAREYSLLEYLLCHQGELLSRNRILDEVWGYESDISTRTVDVHIAKLRHKLNESELPRHIQTVRGQGYRFLL